jgi:translation initiation factor IF-3
MLPASATVASDPARGEDTTHERPGDHIAAEDPRINDRIRAREVRLIGADGSQLGVQPLPAALQMAREQDYDLVEVAPNADPPVCKIMDYERYKYEQQQKRRESKRKATQVVVKEMKFRPKIDQHDYSTKMRHVERFLGEGNKVKLTIMFRGREMAHPELGLRILERIADEVGEIAIVESAPRQDGRNMTMVLHPLKKAGQSSGGAKAAVPRRPRPAAPPESASVAEPAPAVAPESGAT